MMGSPEVGTFLTTVWKAPDLDCATLKMTEDKKEPDGTPTGRFELEGISVALGPPPGALFDVPANYTEMSPMQMDTARAAKSGSTIPEKALKSLQQHESEYIDNHRRAATLH